MRKISYALLLMVFLCISAISWSADYVATDKYLLNCGADSTSDDPDGRQWTSDKGSKFLSSTAHSTTAEASSQGASVPQVPFMTARIFHADFTYTLPLSSGHKFIRLYFYPSTYNNLNAIFSVSTGPYTLLHNFSVSQTTQALNYAYVLKEFSVNVADGMLDITFTPSKDYKNAFAFVNGIEVVSMPDIYNSTDGKTMIVGQTTEFIIDNTTALEHV